MVRIDPFTIRNVAQAGKIVDAWQDPAKRDLMKDVLDRSAGTNERIKAAPLFKALLDAIEPSDPRSGWSGDEASSQTLHDGSGRALAVLSRVNDGWTLESVDQIPFNRLLLETALKALKALKA